MSLASRVAAEEAPSSDSSATSPRPASMSHPNPLGQPCHHLARRRPCRTWCAASRCRCRSTAVVEAPDGDRAPLRKMGWVRVSGEGQMGEEGEGRRAGARCRRMRRVQSGRRSVRSTWGRRASVRAEQHGWKGGQGDGPVGRDLCDDFHHIPDLQSQLIARRGSEGELGLNLPQGVFWVRVAPSEGRRRRA